MGDGSSGFGGGFAELVKDVGGKVGSTVKSSAQTLGSTVITQVTGQTPKPKTSTGTPVQSVPVPTEKTPSGSTLDLGAVFTGEKNPQTTATSQPQQQQYLTQDQLDQTAKANSAKDSARISQVLQELHKQVYYDPLIRKIEGKDKQEKSVQEEHEEDDNKKQMADLEKQKKEEKTKLPPNFREFGKGAKG